MKKTKPDGSKTIYVGGVYEVDKTSGGSVTRTVTYYPAAGAMRINISGASNTVYYILKDHLGSASVVTDGTSPTPQTVAEQRYYPYGETRFTSGTIYTDKLFTRWVDWRSRVETGQREMRRPECFAIEGAGCSAEGYEFWLAETLTRSLLP